MTLVGTLSQGNKPPSCLPPRSRMCSASAGCSKCQPLTGQTATPTLPSTPTPVLCGGPLSADPETLHPACPLPSGGKGDSLQVVLVPARPLPASAASASCLFPTRQLGWAHSHQQAPVLQCGSRVRRASEDWPGDRSCAPHKPPPGPPHSCGFLVGIAQVSSCSGMFLCLVSPWQHRVQLCSVC